MSFDDISEYYHYLLLNSLRQPYPHNPCKIGADVQCFGQVNLTSNEDNHENIIKGPARNYEPDPRGLGMAYIDAMLEHEDLVAQIDVDTGETHSFGYIRKRSIKLAISMKSKGILPGDMVSICSFNNPDCTVAFIAIQIVGAIVASFDPTLSLEDTVFLARKVRPKMIFCGLEAVEMIESVVQEISLETLIVVFGDTEDNIPFENLLESTDEENDFVPYCASSYYETAAILFSSGTTGFPKGICLNHFALMVQGMCKSGTDLSVVCLYSTLYWISAIVLLNNSLLNGVCILIANRFDPLKAWEQLSIYKATYLFLSPFQILSMINVGRPENLDLSCLQDIVIGGGGLSKEQMLNIRSTIPETTVVLIYGQTEVAGALLQFNCEMEDREDLLQKYPNSCGVAAPGCYYKVIDIETSEMVGCNHEGELLVKTDLCMNGYLEEDSSQAWDTEGWLKTGDVAYYNEEKCFFIVDRVKDMLKFRSWHVVPAVLESILMSHPAVQEAVVIGFPHEEDGDHAMGVVVLVEPSTEEEVTPKILEKYVEERVHDRQRLRAGVKIVDRIPKTPSGKPKRKYIREMVLAENL